MGLNDKNQELGEDEANEVHNDQHATKPAQIHILPENQYYPSTLTSTGHSKS